MSKKQIHQNNLTQQYQALSARFGPGVASQMLFKTMGPQGPANAAISRWQHILNLDDWSVKVVFKNVELDDQSSEWDLTRKEATITLSTKLTTDIADKDSYHELMHLVLAPENREFDALCDDLLAEKKIDDLMYRTLQNRFNMAQNITIEFIGKILRRYVP